MISSKRIVNVVLPEKYNIYSSQLFFTQLIYVGQQKSNINLVAEENI